MKKIFKEPAVLSLNEHMMIQTDIDKLDDQLTDDIIANAVSFDIDEDPITLLTNVTLYDETGGVLTKFTVEDYDTAVVYMEETFDVEYADQDERDPDAAAGNSRWGHNAQGGAGGVDSGNYDEY